MSTKPKFFVQIILKEGLLYYICYVLPALLINYPEHNQMFVVMMMTIPLPVDNLTENFLCAWNLSMIYFTCVNSLNPHNPKVYRFSFLDEKTQVK